MSADLLTQPASFIFIYSLKPTLSSIPPCINLFRSFSLFIQFSLPRCSCQCNEQNKMFQEIRNLQNKDNVNLDIFVFVLTHFVVFICYCLQANLLMLQICMPIFVYICLSIFVSICLPIYLICTILGIILVSSPHLIRL